MRLFSGQRYSDRDRAPSVEHRRTIFAASVFLHLAAIVWLITRPAILAETDPEPPPLTTIDLPLPEPEIVEVDERPQVVDVGPPDAPKHGGGGARPARALLEKPVIDPAPVDVPLPAVVLKVPLPVPLAAAPVTGPALIGQGEAGVGSGAGSGAGAGAGRGSGTGSGTGSGDGDAAGRATDTGAGLLQAAEWIVRPTDREMQDLYPWDARTQRVSGTARLSCRVKQKRARDCKVLNESPRGFRFGEAAIEAVRKGRIKAPVVGDQDPEKVRVAILMSFDWTE